MSSRSDSKSSKNKTTKRKKLIDEGEWDCVHCTFKNQPTTGKCEVCDIPRGTSTRQGGYNPQLIAQQELEDMLSKDRARQKRVKARSIRDASVSSAASNPSTPVPSSYHSPSPHLTDTSSMASPPVNPSQSRLRNAKSQSAGTSRVSEASSYDFSEIDPSPSSSSTRTTPSSWKGLEKRTKLSVTSASTSRSTPEKIVGKKVRGRPKKQPDVVASSSGSSLRKAAINGSKRSRKSMFFTILHDGVSLEFEEIIPTDVSDFEDDDRSDDSKSDVS